MRRIAQAIARGSGKWRARLPVAAVVVVVFVALVAVRGRPRSNGHRRPAVGAARRFGRLVESATPLAGASLRVPFFLAPVYRRPGGGPAPASRRPPREVASFVRTLSFPSPAPASASASASTSASAPGARVKVYRPARAECASQEARASYKRPVGRPAGRFHPPPALGSPQEGAETLLAPPELIPFLLCSRQLAESETSSRRRRRLASEFNAVRPVSSGHRSGLPDGVAPERRPVGLELKSPASQPAGNEPASNKRPANNEARAGPPSRANYRLRAARSQHQTVELRTERVKSRNKQ